MSESLSRELIRKELVQIDVEVEDQREYFDRTTDQLVKLGYARPSLKEAIVEREIKYPTALPTKPVPIAIPHSDIEHIIHPFIAVSRFASPIGWHEMGNPSSILQIKYAFMLGFNEKQGHVKLLQVLLKNFGRDGFIEGLRNAKTADELYEACIALDGLK
ncbi:PTS sugar transporter subunit IIA [Corynebacterium pyruviciproducens]|uniref:PTS sugar transporter subunit IIA n=1 Tax=Corynebacterium pyruviciproducens TaxID=598660 RepID=A0AAF1BWM5_9CORY|nr:PTS sugar transporter subunit IIA [Corynebacterium pyruviciproducens]WOT02001.1 PTS sugar transporter subunit IIA [Corynebacterium pyruviciproducens]